MEIEFRWDGVGNVRNFLKRVKKALEPPAITKALGDGADVYVRGAKQRAPKGTGRLSGSIHKQLEDEYSWEVSPSDDLIPIYAEPQEFGAKGNPWMRFQIGGQWVQVRSIRPHPYMQPTFDQDTEAAFEAFKESFLRNIPD